MSNKLQTIFLRLTLIMVSILIVTHCNMFGPNGGDKESEDTPNNEVGPDEEVDGAEGHLFPFYLHAVWQYSVEVKNGKGTDTGFLQLKITEVDASVPSATISVEGKTDGYRSGYDFPSTIYLRQPDDSTLEFKTDKSATWEKTLATGSWYGGDYILVSKEATSTMETSTDSVSTSAGSFDGVKVRSYKSDFDRIDKQGEDETVEQYFCGIGLTKSYHYYKFVDMTG